MEGSNGIAHTLVAAMQAFGDPPRLQPLFGTRQQDLATSDAEGGGGA